MRSALMSIQDMDEMTLRAADMPFTTTSASGHVVPLTGRVSRIAADNRSEYVRVALAYRSALLRSAWSQWPSGLHVWGGDLHLR